jgi:hypothetical protein
MESSTLIADLPLPLPVTKPQISNAVDPLAGNPMEKQRLSSRDIPQSEPHFELQLDAQTKPNFIEHRPSYDHVMTMDTDDMILKRKKSKHHRIRMADDLLVMLQRPILLSLLFFLFQLPAIRLFFFKYLSFLGLTTIDGNLSIAGMTFFSMLFGSCVFALDFAVAEWSE